MTKFAMGLQNVAVAAVRPWWNTGHENCATPACWGSRTWMKGVHKETHQRSRDTHTRLRNILVCCQVILGLPSDSFCCHARVS